MVAAAIAGLTARTRWELTGSVPLSFDVQHPQGMAPCGGGWLVTTVDVDTRSGSLLSVAADGTLIDRWPLTDGDRFHPGGLDVVPATTETWLAVAEYRPDSTTTVFRAASGHRPEPAFTFDDHLGAICRVDGGMLFAVSWGSRRLYLLDDDGRVLDSRPNPQHYCDYQDVQHLGDGVVSCSGVIGLRSPAGRVQLGGLALWDAHGLQCTHETPVSAWSPTGRAATFNPVHIEAGATTVHLHAVPDDGQSALHVWQADQGSPAGDPS